MIIMTTIIEHILLM